MANTTVRASLVFTRNLGNFESVKIGYDIESDDRKPDETLDEFKARLKAKVEKWVEDDINEIDSARAAQG